MTQRVATTEAVHQWRVEQVDSKEGLGAQKDGKRLRLCVGWGGGGVQPCMCKTYAHMCSVVCASGNCDQSPPAGCCMSANRLACITAIGTSLGSNQTPNGVGCVWTPKLTSGLETVPLCVHYFAAACTGLPPGPHILLTTYKLVQQLPPQTLGRYHVVIVDESHKLKNPTTDQ